MPRQRFVVVVVVVLRAICLIFFSPAIFFFFFHVRFVCLFFLHVRFVFCFFTCVLFVCCFFRRALFVCCLLFIHVRLPVAHRSSVGFRLVLRNNAESAFLCPTFGTKENGDSAVVTVGPRI